MSVEIKALSRFCPQGARWDSSTPFWSQKTWKTSRPVPYVALVESEYASASTSHMRFSSAFERRGLGLPSECGDVVGLHRRSLSLAEQSGCSGEGVGVRLVGKRPIASEFAVCVRELRCPKRLRPKLVPLRGGFRFVEVSGNFVDVFVFPPVPRFSPCGRVRFG